MYMYNVHMHVHLYQCYYDYESGNLMCKNVNFFLILHSFFGSVIALLYLKLSKLAVYHFEGEMPPLSHTLGAKSCK